MPAFLLTAALLTALNVSGEVRAGDGDYVAVAFTVPEGTAEIHIATDYPEDGDILDWGVWDPSGMRGWSGGLRDAITIGKEDSSRGYQPGAIEPGTWTLVIGKAQLESSVVPWTGTIEFYDEATLSPRSRSTFTPVVLDTAGRWYAGDFHVHTRESGDARASLEQVYDLAKSEGLDFVVVSDHNTSSGHALQANMQEGVSDLLFVRGDEVTTYGGHGNALGVDMMIDHRIGFEGRSADDLIAEVKGAGGLFAVNHPVLGLLGTCIGCSWEHDIDWSKVSALEVQNGDYDSGITIFTPLVIDLWEEKLSEGFRLAAIGGSDDHRAGIDLESHQSPIGSPTTYVLADSLSEADILRGVAEGRTWIQLAGPTSPYLELALTAPGGTTGTIGDTLAGDVIDVSLTVRGAAGHQAVLYRDGEVLATESISDDADTVVVLQAVVPEAGARFHVEISDGLAKAITSHFYATYEAPPKKESGGCQAAGNSSGAGLWLLLIVIIVTWRRRGAVLVRARG